MLGAFFRASAIRAVCGRLRVGVRARARLRVRARASVAARVTALRDRKCTAQPAQWAGDLTLTLTRRSCLREVEGAEVLGDGVVGRKEVHGRGRHHDLLQHEVRLHPQVGTCPG